MKKKSGFLILSHKTDRVRLSMRFAFIIGLLSMIMFLSPGSLNAAGKAAGNDEETAPQQVKISGTITDATTKEPLVGVNVVLVGTTVGVMTGSDGKFSLNVPNLTGKLSVSCIGYVTQEIVIGNQTTIDVTLAPDLTSLDEVVVIGYGDIQQKGCFRFHRFTKGR